MPGSQPGVGTLLLSRAEIDWIFFILSERDLFRRFLWCYGTLLVKQRLGGVAFRFLWKRSWVRIRTLFEVI